jgi:hypothetical protein
VPVSPLTATAIESIVAGAAYAITGLLCAKSPLGCIALNTCEFDGPKVGIARWFLWTIERAVLWLRIAREVRT